MLTTIGRLTVIKTLKIPKMKHLILTLPNPDKDFFKNFETEYTSIFEMVKSIKNIIIQEYRFGGLKMLEYFEFITALKLSWIRRLMQCRTKWKNLLEAIIKEKVNSLWLKGTDFIADISNSINNIFWKEVFCSWIKIVKITADQIENIPFEHIWSNTRLKINNELSYQKSFHRAGLSLIIDLFDTDGEFLSQETLKHFNVNFLDYAGLRKTVLKRIELCDIKKHQISDATLYS